MKSPAKSKRASKQQIVTLKSIPAPTGGWNAVDALSDMVPTDAVVLDNFFPRTAYCELRGGYESHATGMTGNGKTLVVHNGITGTNKMFCATSSGVYNVSSAGAVGASVAARTNGKHQWLMFGDGTNQWLIMVNGTDGPLYYNGTTWVLITGVSVPALTGLTASTLIGVAQFKGRLMFIQVSDLGFWYLASGAAGGALSHFPLDGVAQRGGYLMAMAAWTLDSGAGPEDRMVFVTSEGECIVYQGTDPNIAANWSLVGVYPVGKPLGRRCILQSGSDLIILTENGVFQINTIVQATGANYKDAVSRKIENAFNTSARSYFSNFGWQAVVLPRESAVIVNVPAVEDGTHYQYVMNTITRAWCRFIGWDGEDFAVFNNELYFCIGTTVKKAWSGVSDGGSDIVCYGKPAFSYFGNNSQLKKFNMFRPVLAVDGSLDFKIDIDLDFEDSDIIGVSSSAVSTSALWDSALWDSASWVGGLDIIKTWEFTREWLGYAASGKLKINTNNRSVQWISCDYVYESGGIL